MIIKLKYALLSSLLLLLATCVRFEQKAMEINNPSPSAQSVNKARFKVPTILGDEKVRKTILDYMEKNNCRIPEASDFAFSEKSLEDIHNIVGDYWVQTIAYDNFDDSPPLNDFAVMLINKGDIAPNSFQLVFFLEKTTGYQAIAMLNHVNLSTSTMSKQSQGWYLSTYDNEGGKKNCYFMWDSKGKIIKCREER